jgi:lipopolysaccharide biosynthesis glycosyltransferase
LPVGRLPMWCSSSQYSPMAYVRCILTSHLPPGLGRYLYLDTDLLVDRDVTELFAIDLGGNPVGMVRQRALTETVCNYVRDRLQLDLDGYYNTGVMLMDGDKFRSGNYDAGLLSLGSGMSFAPWFAD